MRQHTTFSMETQGKSALLIRTSRCCRFVYLSEFTGTCSSIHSIKSHLELQSELTLIELAPSPYFLSKVFVLHI